jgi:PAS domain S-box-containing protein
MGKSMMSAVESVAGGEAPNICSVRVLPVDVVIESKTANFEKSRREHEHSAHSLQELRLIYDTAPIGLAFLSLDCRYLQINQRLTEICGISVADHIGRSVRETVPAVAEQVESIVAAVLRTGKPVMGIPVKGQRPDKSNVDRQWITNWHPLVRADGSIAGVNVVAEETTDRKRAESVLAASERALRDSETRFHELADNISQFAWTADATGWIHWYNRRWHDYTGTIPDGTEGRGWQKALHPDHVARVKRVIRDCFETGTPWEDTFPLRGRDGSYRWFLSRALPIRNQAGEVVRWFGTHTDVTRQIEAEKALRDLNATLGERVEAETRQRMHIWNVSQDLLVVADLEGKCLSVNPAWTAVLGWSEAELVGSTSDWLLHPDDREKSTAELGRLVAGRRTLLFENRLRDNNGAYHRISWQAVSEGGLIYGMGRDVTELREAATALREVQGELARVTRQSTLAAMTASIAHEIGQPLSAIATNASAGLRWLTRTDPNFDEARAAFTEIVEDVHRASDVIASIRGMLRKDSHEKTTFDVNDVVRQILALMHGELEKHDVVAQQHLSGNLPPIVGERVQLQQVVLNLVMNAVEAMGEVSGRRRSLSVNTRAVDPPGVLVTVADTGHGIGPGQMDRIFDAFFTTKPQGMGMGLSICQSIVTAHGGRLWATPGEPHGTIFHVQLPADAASGG